MTSQCLAQLHFSSNLSVVIVNNYVYKIVNVRMKRRADPSPLYFLGDHDDDPRVFLPDHSPEIVHRLLETALRADVRPLDPCELRVLVRQHLKREKSLK